MFVKLAARSARVTKLTARAFCTGYGLGVAKEPGRPVLIAAVHSSSRQFVNVSAFLDQAAGSTECGD